MEVDNVKSKKMSLCVCEREREREREKERKCVCVYVCVRLEKESREVQLGSISSTKCKNCFQYSQLQFHNLCLCVNCVSWHTLFEFLSVATVVSCSNVDTTLRSE